MVVDVDEGKATAVVGVDVGVVFVDVDVGVVVVDVDV